MASWDAFSFGASDETDCEDEILQLLLTLRPDFSVWSYADGLSRILTATSSKELCSMATRARSEDSNLRSHTSCLTGTSKAWPDIVQYGVPADADEEAELSRRNIPPFPPLLLPISTNLLIIATSRRICKVPPVSDEKCDASLVLFEAVYLLLSYWWLKDQGNSKIPALIKRSLTFLAKHHTEYHAIVAAAEAASVASHYSFVMFESPAQLKDAIDAMGDFLA
ncbi:hypothetical protein JCM11251_007576 [Rhodosporidiobolus azoricus]